MPPILPAWNPGLHFLALLLQDPHSGLSFCHWNYPRKNDSPRIPDCSHRRQQGICGTGRSTTRLSAPPNNRPESESFYDLDWFFPGRGSISRCCLPCSLILENKNCRLRATVWQDGGWYG